MLMKSLLGERNRIRREQGKKREEIKKITNKNEINIILTKRRDEEGVSDER